MPKELIYAVDDELHIQELIRYNLENVGYTVFTFNDGESLLDECSKRLPDILLLDLMLPGIDGFDLCRTFRENKQTSNLPIIMLTAKTDEFDRVLGLELGADDYLTKPFSIRELLARVKALVRRIKSFQNNNSEEILKHGDITINPQRREVYKNNTLLDLTLKEFELLKTLIQNKGIVLTRDSLMDKIWGADYYGDSRTIDVHIRYLRQKLDTLESGNGYIETIRGIGYKLVDK